MCYLTLPEPFAAMNSLYLDTEMYQCTNLTLPLPSSTIYKIDFCKAVRLFSNAHFKKFSAMQKRIQKHVHEQNSIFTVRVPLRNRFWVSKQTWQKDLS